MNKLELFPEIETTEADLLDHNEAVDLKLRIFNTVAGSTVMVVVLRETAHSFLVALPCKLLASGDRRLVEPLMPVRFCRFMKATLPYVVPCYGEFELYYIRFLVEQGKALYPSLFENGFEEKLKARLEKLVKRAEEMRKELDEIASKELSDPDSPIMAPPINKYKH
jgi:hypothetical protein